MVFQISLFQLIFTDLCAQSWRISKLERETSSHVFKNTLSRHNKTVPLALTEKILKFFRCKGQDNLQNIAIKILDYKFPLNYRQTFDRQNGKKLTVHSKGYQTMYF